MAAAVALGLVALVVPPSPAPASNCYTCEFIGARGSGKPPQGSDPWATDPNSGMGPEMFATYTKVKDALRGPPPRRPPGVTRQRANEPPGQSRKQQLPAEEDPDRELAEPKSIRWTDTPLSVCARGGI